MITVHLPDYFIEGLHELVRQKKYPHRSEIIRSAIKNMLSRELLDYTTTKSKLGLSRKCNKCGADLFFTPNEDIIFCSFCKCFYPSNH